MPNAKDKLILEEESKETGLGKSKISVYGKLAVKFVDVRVT